MVFARRRFAKRRVGRKGKKPTIARRKAGRRQARTQDRAKLVESTEYTAGLLSNIGNTLTFNLQQYQRAQEVAHAYKYYRASHVEITFVPYSNISQVGGAAAARLPNLYMTVDRVANQQINPSENEMLERGCKPKIFNKIMKLKWKPNLLQHVQLETEQPSDGGGNPLGVRIISALNSIPIFNKWLPTQQSYGYTGIPPNSQIGLTRTPNAANPYALNYYGAAWIVDLEGAASSIPMGDYQVRVTWEFKGPRALHTNPPSAEPYTPAQQATDMSQGVVANSQPTQYP